MSIHLTFITHNRLEYTKLSLASVLADPKEKFTLTIWDNASSDGTLEYLKNMVKDNRIDDIIFSKKNVGQTAAVNEIWEKSKADLLGKLDNDCLMTPGWTEILSQAHSDISELGVVACWHFRPEDFDYAKAKRKIQQFGKHQIFRHPFTCGTGVLIKKETFDKLGPIQDNAMTQYWIKMAVSGYINGWYFPFIYQEHMEDPLSPHCMYHDDESLRAIKEITYSLRVRNIDTLKKRLKRREDVLDNLLYGSPYIESYIGWRKKIMRFFPKLNRWW